MTTTRWERERALSDRVRAVWDAHRDGREWEEVYTDAREATARRLEADAALIRAMTWGQFLRLQGIQEGAGA